MSVYLCGTSMPDNFVYELTKFKFQTPSKRTDRRDSSQFFEPDRVGMEAARPCFLFLYYPTLILSFLAKARRRPEKWRQHRTIIGIRNIIEPILPLLLSLYRSLGGN